jgi:hypothetical protein
MTIQEYLQKLAEVPNLLYEQLMETEEASALKRAFEHAKGFAEQVKRLDK